MKAPCVLAATFAFALLALLAAHPASAQVPDQLKHSFINPNTSPQGGTRLGSSVAMDGDYTVVGVPGEPNQEGFPAGGGVKVFSSTTGALLFTILGPNKNYEGHIGAAVAISGSRIAVGAPGIQTPYFGAVFIYDLSSSRPTIPVAVLPNPLPRSEGDFGYSVAISGTRVAVGEYLDGYTDSGKAWVFDLASATPAVPVLALENPVPSVSDSNATAVALSGGKLVVGVSLDAEDESGPSWAYVYDLDGAAPAVPMMRLEKPGPFTGNTFANAVAISGTRVVVADYWDSTGANYAGSVYVFDLANPTPANPVVVLHNPNPTVFGQFGYSVAIAGKWVVVGANGDSAGGPQTGSAYVYDLTSATPAVPFAKPHKPLPVTGDSFGQSVAVAGNRVVVGAPYDDALASNAGSAFVFDLTTNTPSLPAAALNSPSPPVYDNFGVRATISGTLMAAGAAGDAVYVYRLNSATPTAPITVLHHPQPENLGGSGSIAISGTRLVVSAGNLYVYDFAAGTPTAPDLTITPPPNARFDAFSHPVAISGSRVAVAGSYGTFPDQIAAVFVYDIGSSTPSTPVAILSDPEPDFYGTFGYALAISGTRVVVTDQLEHLDSDLKGTGTVYVYDLSSATPTVPTATVDATDRVSSYFGYAIAIFESQLVILDPGLGKTYLHDLSSSTPTVPTFAWDAFGLSVAISGTRIVIGNEYDSIGAYGSGSAQVFDLSSPTPGVPVALLKNPTPIVGDAFGTWVAIDGATIVVGTPYDGTAGYEQGAAYVFGPSPYSLWKVAELGDPFAPNSADDDHDGLGNFAEYGLLRSPTIPEGAATSAAPFLYPDGRRLRMFVPRDPVRDDITLEVQASGTLSGPWVTIAVSDFGAPFYGPGYFSGDGATPGVKSVEVRDTVNMDAALRRFLRVRVRR